MTFEPTIPLNAKTIGLLMALIGALTFGWNVVSYFKELELKNFEQDMRLDRTDRDRIRNIEAINKLTVKADELKEAVIRLTAVIEQQEAIRKAEVKRDMTGLPAELLVKSPR